MVFLHECTHAKKRDLWYKLIFTAGKLYLLVPAGGLASEKCSPYQDVEVACDQSVAVGKGLRAERDAYAKFLLDSLRRGREKNSQAYSAYFYNSKRGHAGQASGGDPGAGAGLPAQERRHFCS